MTDSDLRDYLSGWQELLDGLEFDISCLDDGAGLARWNTHASAQLAATGWLSLPTADDVPFALQARCLERLHRRVLPLPLPLLETWLAMTALQAVEGSPESRQLLELVLAGDRQVMLPVGALFHSLPSRRPVVVPMLGLPELLAIRVEDGTASLLLTEQPEIEHVDLDPTLRSGRWSPAGNDCGQPIGRLQPDQVAMLRSAALTMQAAALLGQGTALFDAAVEYLATRRQFGKLIGQFQALRHLAADLHVQLLGARLSLDFALAGKQLRPRPWPDMAKATCGQVALRASSESLQIHGGFGFTWEAGLHLGLRRCMYHVSSGPSVDACFAALGRYALETEQLSWPEDDREYEPGLEFASN